MNINFSTPTLFSDSYESDICSTPFETEPFNSYEEEYRNLKPNDLQGILNFLDKVAHYEEYFDKGVELLFKHLNGNADQLSKAETQFETLRKIYALMNPHFEKIPHQGDFLARLTLTVLISKFKQKFDIFKLFNYTPFLHKGSSRFTVLNEAVRELMEKTEIISNGIFRKLFNEFMKWELNRLLLECYDGNKNDPTFKNDSSYLVSVLKAIF